jgi:hypothetical protein
MILPTKHLAVDKSLLAIGSRILSVLPRPRTVTGTWEEVRRDYQELPFESFALALTFLYTIGAIRMSDDLIRRDR